MGRLVGGSVGAAASSSGQSKFRLAGRSRRWPWSSRIMFALMPCLVRLHATEDGQGREIDHFQQHKWLMNVFSVGNFTHAGVRFGSQIQLHMEGAWVAKELGRGWIAPNFVHQPRDSRVAEEMTDNGTIADSRWSHPYIITTEPTLCEELFSCRRQDFASYNPAFLTLAQLSTFGHATIDHLLVHGRQAGIIGGQACADLYNCSNFKCPVQAHDTGGARHMEFFGQRFSVKKVSCFPVVDKGESWGPKISAAMKAAISAEDKIVAVASSAVEFHEKPVHLHPTLALLRPSPAVLRLMEMFTKQIGGAKYVASHWRRGDRGHPEMGHYAKIDWELSQPMHFACLLSDLVLQAGVRNVLVMTNAGRPSDRFWLRSYVNRWSGAEVLYLQDFADSVVPESPNAGAESAMLASQGVLQWDRWNNYDVLVAELLLSADAVDFLSAGPNFQFASTLSRFVEDLRRARGHPQSTTRYMHQCQRPHPEDLAVSVHVQPASCSDKGTAAFTADLRGLAQGSVYQISFVVKVEGHVVRQGDLQLEREEFRKVQETLRVDIVQIIPLPDLSSYAGAPYSLQVMLFDLYPGLQDDERMIGTQTRSLSSFPSCTNPGMGTNH